MLWKNTFERFEKAKEYGFSFRFDKNSNYYSQETYRNALDYGIQHVKNKDCNPPYKPKVGSHDDGPINGPFLGGIGTSNFSRDALGYFSRWHLQQGVHINEAIDSAFFMIRWEYDGKTSYKKIRISKDDFSNNDVEYTALFPKVYEKYNRDDMPFELILEYYSPMIPHNYKDSILPITLFNVHLIPKTKSKVDVSIGLCWPNLLGWKNSYMTSEQRQDKLWPSHQNGGNTGKVEYEDNNIIHIMQCKTMVGNRKQDMNGNIMISMDAGDQWTPSYDCCFRESKMTTGFQDKDQLKTIGKVEYDFRSKGALSNNCEGWEAHWHEPICSAVAAKTGLLGKEASLVFGITMDMPITTFGMGRSWYKAYTEYFGKDCSRTLELANYALQNNEEWLKQIDIYHDSVFNDNEILDKKVLGAKINELYFVPGGGSTLVTDPVDGHDEDTKKLDNKIHYGVLEGFDTGYYYYNTLDLWVYAFPALTKNWPELAESVFKDYLASAILADNHKNMIYRNGKKEDNLVYGKLPHDFGGCAEDLFVRLNGYNFRDNPNMWIDHNPSFVCAFYLHKSLCKEEITEKEYEIMKIIMDFVAKQDVFDIGVPRHTEFGDSTWDNLDMKGVSIYCGGLCVTAWAIMKKLAEKFNDTSASYYNDKLVKSQKTTNLLWNGKYYNTNELGKYKNATMTDSLLGILLAKKAGINNLLPEEKIKSHILSIYQNNVKAYADGKYGALLVAEPGKCKYEKDGGDELQVNEVLVGSNWILVDMLLEFGFHEEAKELSNNIRNLIYDNTGLQFRTPAAWDNDGHYRAPLNMRPLSIWMI